MKKIRIGRPVKKTNKSEKDYNLLSNLMLCVGIISMSAMLIIPLSTRYETLDEPAVMAMSNNITVNADEIENKEKINREELIIPNKKDTTVDATEWSFFDSIGMWFAELIFGEH